MWPATWGCCHPGKDWTASWQNVQCSCVGVEHWKGAAHTACCVVESHAWRSLIICRRYQCYRRVGMRLPPCLETELKSAPVGNDFLLLFVGKLQFVLCCDACSFGQWALKKCCGDLCRLHALLKRDATDVSLVRSYRDHTLQQTERSDASCVNNRRDVF